MAHWPTVDDYSVKALRQHLIAKAEVLSARPRKRRFGILRWLSRWRRKHADDAPS
jgi:hypothetical protein